MKKRKKKKKGKKGKKRKLKSPEMLAAAKCVHSEASHSFRNNCEALSERRI